MAENDLTLRKADFYEDVAHYLGYGRGEEQGDPAWTTRQLRDVKKIVDAGYRQFLQPPPLPGERVAHDWSFLRPQKRITLAEGASAAPLPDDFGGLEGTITVLSADARACAPLRVVNPGEVSQLHAASPDSSGAPAVAALQTMKGVQAAKGERRQLYVFPTADAEYTLEVQYYLLAHCLTDDHPWAYGGAVHSETIKASCLAVAELEMDGRVGERTAKWLDRLAASVSADRRMKSQHLGKNADRSDDLRGGRSRDYGVVVTYNGNAY